MGLFRRLGRQVGEFTAEAKAAAEEHAARECAACGAAVDGGRDECPECGSAELRPRERDGESEERGAEEQESEERES